MVRMLEGAVAGVAAAEIGIVGGEAGEVVLAEDLRRRLAARPQGRWARGSPRRKGQGWGADVVRRDRG